MPAESQTLAVNDSEVPAFSTGCFVQQCLEIQVQTQSVVPHVRVSRTVGWELVDYLCAHFRISFSCDNSHFTIYFSECDAHEAQARLDEWIVGKSHPASPISKSARLSSWIVG